MFPIHESFSEFPEPSYDIKTFAHHYGYAYESDEQRKEKLKRNLPLLYKELEKNPDDLRTYLHIYSGIDDEERLKLLPTMIEKARKQTHLIQAAGIFVQAIEF